MLSLSLISTKDADNPLSQSKFKKKKNSAARGKHRKACASPSGHDLFVIV